MLGFRFSAFVPDPDNGKPIFDRLLDIFLELVTYTAGDAAEALAWMNELDKEYSLTTADYGMGDFLSDLMKKGFLKEEGAGEPLLTAKAEQGIRSRSLEQIFGKLKRSGRGEHRSPHSGRGTELTSDTRPYQFGDTHEQVDFTASLQNAYVNHGIDDFKLESEDLEVRAQQHEAQCSTVLMIDVSHSMILYGEDRITPAKKVAMALSELIMQKYPKDSLDILAFGDDAFPIAVKDLPYLQVGPFHTNTVAGLELAMEMLRRRKHPNKQIFMITDGKPSCLKEGGDYYKNSFGLDRKIVNRCLMLARQARKSKITITTFMIAQDPYLQQFVAQFTEANQGKAFYSGLKGLGEFVFHDYQQNRRKRMR
ncbi:MAG: vWA domain-containing protein [Bacteroidia bacterium]